MLILFDSWYAKKSLVCLANEYENLDIVCNARYDSAIYDNQTCKEQMQYLPLFAYSFRWYIEVSYYEQKTFWSLCSYMIRNKKGIETMVNLINISYCTMKILPYKDETFSKYKDTSVQEFRFALSQQIN